MFGASRAAWIRPGSHPASIELLLTAGRPATVGRSNCGSSSNLEKLREARHGRSRRIDELFVPEH